MCHFPPDRCNLAESAVDSAYAPARRRALQVTRLGCGWTSVPDFVSLKTILEEAEEAGFTEAKTWDWRQVEHGKHEDHSQAYIPHMDKTHGRLMSLNVECANRS